MHKRPKKKSYLEFHKEIVKKGFVLSSMSEASFKLLSACEMNIPSVTVGNLIKCFSADSQRLANEFDDIIHLLGGKFQEITD